MMTRRIVALFTISAFLGLGYLVWTRTGIGSLFMRFWLLRIWKKEGLVKSERATKRELRTLGYERLFLLWQYTRYHFTQPSFLSKRKMAKIKVGLKDADFLTTRPGLGVLLSKMDPENKSEGTRMNK